MADNEAVRNRVHDSLDPLLSIEEVSDYLGIPVGTLRNWRLAGKGPVSFRPGRHIRYRVSDVRAYIDGLVEKR